MKLLIFSDIHGDANASTLLTKLDSELKPERILLLGDILYHGPRNDLPSGYAPKRVIAHLNPLKDKIIAVRGNCEAEVDQMVLDFPVMSESAMLFVDGRVWMMSHGHIIKADNHPPCDCFLSGHTHIPTAEVKDGTVLINPGSPSIPKGGYKPSYGWYEDGTFSIKALDGSLLMSYSFASGKKRDAITSSPS